MNSYRGKYLFDGEKLVENFSFTEENGIIVNVGKYNDVPDAKDLGDSFVMPGIIDCHVHVTGNPETDQLEFDYDNPVETGRIVIEGTCNMKTILKAGLTTIRDLGSTNGIAISLRNGQKKGVIQGPHIVCAGELINYSKGNANGNDKRRNYINGVDMAREAARRQFALGADVIKLYTTGGIVTFGDEYAPCLFLEDEIRAAIQVAKRYGMMSSAHAQGKTAIITCSNAGISSIEHGVYIDEETAAVMKKNQTFIVPTLSAPHFAVKEGLRKNPDDPAHKGSQSVINTHNTSFTRAFKTGVPAANGSDTGNGFNYFENAPYELVLVSKLLSVENALKIATSSAAKLLRLEGKKGVIKKGADADFLVLRENPFDNIETVMDKKEVFQSGKLVI